jgi:pimeloyl-ACP methyl ester carboxylesterase
MKENTYLCNGVALNCMEYSNQGPTVLLLHGATNRWQSFMPIIPALANHYHVYALDFRGHGKSAHMESYTLDDYLSDTYAFINEYVKKPVTVIGHSLGGMIGALLAAYYPEQVRQLVMIDAPLTLQSLKRLSSGPMEHASWLIQGLRYSQLVPGLPMPEGLRQCDPEMLLATVNQFEKTFRLYKAPTLFTKIMCAALLIRGSVELGSLITDADLKNILKLMPHLKHIKIEHAGHAPINQEEQAVLHALHSFLAA